MPDSARTRAHQAATALRAQLDRHGITVLDLRVDPAAILSGVASVHIGTLDAEAAQRLADALSRSTPRPPATTPA